MAEIGLPDRGNSSYGERRDALFAAALFGTSKHFTAEDVVEIARCFEQYLRSAPEVDDTVGMHNAPVHKEHWMIPPDAVEITVGAPPDSIITACGPPPNFEPFPPLAIMRVEDERVLVRWGFAPPEGSRVVVMW